MRLSKTWRCVKPIFLIALFSIHTWISPCPLSASGEGPKNVLFISSYHPGFPTFFQQVEGIKSVFEEKPILLDIEFMDTKRFADRENLDNFYRSLSTKLSRTEPYDALITGDDNALSFVLEHQQELFLDLPIVFMGVNNVDRALEQNTNPYIAGVIEAVSMKETLGVMTRIHPEAKRIIALVDGTPSGQGDLTTFYRHKEAFAPVVLSEISLTDLSFDEFAEQLKRLGDEDVVLLLSAYRDKNDKSLLFHESLQLIKESLSRPLYHLWFHGMGDGVLGGKVISHYQQGKAAAEMVLEVLAGRPVGNISVTSESPNAYIFDYRELQRFGLNISDLPEDSVILNEPRSYYQEHKRLIWTVVAVFLGYSLLVIGMWINIRHRKRADLALRRGTKLLENIIANIPIYVFWKDRSSRYLGCNQRFASAAGVGRPENIVGKTDDDLAWRREEARVARLTDQKVMADRMSLLDVEETCLLADGQEATLLTSKVPLEDEAGNVMGVLAICADMTLRKRAEETLRKSEEAARALLNATLESLILIDTEGVVLAINQVGAERLGKRPDEFIGTNIFDCLPPELAQDRRTRFEEVVRTGKPMRFEDHRGDFDFSNSYFPAFDQQGKVERIAVFAMDITDLKQSENALRESEERFRSIFESAAAPMAILSLEGALLQVNPATCQLFGYAEEEFLKLTVDDVTHPDDREKTRALYDELLSGDRKAVSYEKRYLRKAGSTLWGHTTIAPVRDPEGNLLYFVALTQDITERKRAEKALKKSRAGLESSQRIAHLGSWEWDSVKNKVLLSDEFYRLFGLDPQKFIPLPEKMYELIHPDDREALQQATERALRGEEDFHIEYRGILTDGSVRYFDAQGEVTFDEAGWPVRMVGTTLDITERKRAEEAMNYPAASYGVSKSANCSRCNC